MDYKCAYVHIHVSSHVTMEQVLPGILPWLGLMVLSVHRGSVCSALTLVSLLYWYSNYYTHNYVITVFVQSHWQERVRQWGLFAGGVIWCYKYCCTESEHWPVTIVTRYSHCLSSCSFLNTVACHLRQTLICHRMIRMLRQQPRVHRNTIWWVQVVTS